MRSQGKLTNENQRGMHACLFGGCMPAHKEVTQASTHRLSGIDIQRLPAQTIQREYFIFT